MPLLPRVILLHSLNKKEVVEACEGVCKSTEKYMSVVFGRLEADGADDCVTKRVENL